MDKDRTFVLFQAILLCVFLSVCVGGGCNMVQQYFLICDCVN